MKNKESIWKSIVFQWFSFVFCYYGPGDRAQKNSPGGPKTEESFWKAQNDVEISIIRFPMFFITIALVIERKKLAPEARKQRRASERHKMTSKIKLFVSYVFCYYSPGDGAQKVSPRDAKTNESCWKSQNDVKKSIIRFTIIFVYYSPGDRAQKIVLEARKQRRASERLKMTSKIKL